MPLPTLLKPLLVRIWNTANQCGWLGYDYLGAVGAGRLGRCVVCGRFGLLIYRRRVVTRRLVELWGLSPRLARAFARKESCSCTHCGANLRGRRIAQVVLSIHPVGDSPARSMAEWVEQPAIRQLRVAEINTIDGLHSFLQKLPRFFGSDYVGERATASHEASERSEDLTRLSYPDGSFDLVLTSETLEHVNDLHAALCEIDRVLAPGGRHVFTVPVLPATRHTFSRSIVRPDGSIEHRAPRICHPGGDWGYPVFTEFGTDLPELLGQHGSETTVYFGPVSDDDIAQVYVSRKPAG